MYELYISTLPSTGWPAAELVEAYYNRVVVENRFGQTDNEQGRQRIVSWHLPGQELANAVSLFVWNLRLIWGADLAGWKPTPEPEPRPRQPPVAPSGSSGRDEAGTAGAKTSEPAHTPSSEVKCPAVEPAPMAIALTNASEHESCTGEEVATSTNASKRSIAYGQVTAAFVAGLRWSSLLERLPGWRWNSEDQVLLCPAGESMRWRSPRQRSPSSLMLEFRVRRAGACRDCVRRSECTKSDNPRFVKDLSVTITGADLPSPLAQNHVAESATRTPGFQVHDEPPQEPGPSATRAPLLVPSVFRRQLGRVLGGCRLRVESPRPPLVSHPPPWLAVDANERQHRRRIFGDRDARCLLPVDHPLTVHVVKSRGRTAASLRKLIASSPVQRKDGAIE